MINPPTTRELTQGVSRAVVFVARTGYAARGVIYLLVGGLALLSAMGHSEGSTTDSKGALERVLRAPGGWIILIVIGIGLICYALWRGVQSIFDTDRCGTEMKGLTVRSALMISALTHILLAISAIRRGIGYVDDESNSRASWTAWLMRQPAGRWVIGTIGLAIVGAGLAQIAKGWSRDFRKRLDIREESVRRLIPICRFGVMARGVVFVMVGSFFVFAAWTYDASNAGGIGDAFNTVRSVSYGQLLLAATALGVVSFAIYSFVQAWCRIIDPPR